MECAYDRHCHFNVIPTPHGAPSRAVQRNWIWMPDEIPRAGECFIDSSGTYWRVQDVTASERLAGFFLVRLAYGPTPVCDSGRLLLAKREFVALVRDKGLQPLRP